MEKFLFTKPPEIAENCEINLSSGFSKWQASKNSDDATKSYVEVFGFLANKNGKQCEQAARLLVAPLRLAMPF